MFMHIIYIVENARFYIKEIPKKDNKQEGVMNTFLLIEAEK